MSSTLSSRMDPQRVAELRALLMETVEGAASGKPAARLPEDAGAGATEPRRRRVPRSVAFGAIAVGAVGLGTGAAVSVTQFLQPDRLTVMCVLGTTADSEQVEKRATVADPLASCRREWSSEADVPELAVFMNPYGTVFVAPESWDSANQDAEPVAQDVAFDPRPARLQAALDDRIDGLQSDCFSQEEALSRVESDLQRLGLVAWSVRSDDNGGREEPADGVQTCAWAFVPEEDGSVREVVVRGAMDDVAPEPRRAVMSEAELRTYYAQEYRSAVESGLQSEQSEQAWVEESITNTLAVREELAKFREMFGAGRCLTAGQAEEQATSVMDPAWNPVVDVSIDNTLDCAIIEIGMGGTWLVSIVGPETVPET